MMNQTLLADIDRSLKREINLAKNIQATLLNCTPPKLTMGEITGISIPARQVGGDYYDFCELPDGKIRMLIGDVMGKGIPAAMLMILTRGAFRSLSQKAKGPAETLTLLNQALYEDLRSLRSFVTLFCADWDSETKKLSYSNAGHNHPLLISNSQEYKFLESKGIMVGGLQNQKYEEYEITMEKDDYVFFYTDGIIEAENTEGEFFGKDRLIELLTRNSFSKVTEVKESVLKELQFFTHNHYQKDDITMLIFKY
jgi:sigma-B regulation protein RsbU (phosphoserine phosphatase)